MSAPWIGDAAATTRRRSWVRAAATLVLAVAVSTAACVGPMLIADPGVVSQAAASPKPGDPGGNHSKPGDNKKKKKDDDDNRSSSKDDGTGGEEGSASQRDSGSNSDFADQSNANNRWTPDGANRSVNTHSGSDADQQRQQPLSPTRQQQTPAGETPESAPLADPTTTAEPPPPSTTAGSAPPSGSKLQLGNDTGAVQDLVAKAAPLREQLSQLQAQDWQIRYTQPGDLTGSYTNVRDHIIVIDRQYQGDVDQVTETLAHEVGHAIYGDRTDYSSRDAYVQSLLNSEGAATLNNIRVQRWITSTGGPDIGIAGTHAQDYEIAYTNYIRSDGDFARAASTIGNIFGTGEHPSTDPTKTYAELYGSFYDQHYAK